MCQTPLKWFFVVVDAVKLRRSFVKITRVLKFRTLKINIQKNHNEKNEVKKIKKMWGKLAFIVYPNVVIVLYLRVVHKKMQKATSVLTQIKYDQAIKIMLKQKEIM